MSVVTSTPLTIDHFIADLSAFVSTGYDSIRWYRSRGGENGAYEAATGATAAAASIACDDEPYNIVGKTLSLMVNGDQRVDVTFASPAPIDGIAAGEEICGEGSLLTYVVTDGRLVLSTVETGSDASF